LIQTLLVSIFGNVKSKRKLLAIKAVEQPALAEGRDLANKAAKCWIHCWSRLNESVGNPWNCRSEAEVCTRCWTDFTRRF